MKKSHFIVATAILAFIVLGCTESENIPVPEADPSTSVATDTVSTVDTVVGTMVDTLTHTPVGARKHIYLTIDDAPLNGSAYLDSIVRSMQIKTCIFMVGNGIDGSHRFRKYYNDMKVNPFIEIYNHSYSHARNKYTQYYTHPTTVLEDFEKNQTDFQIQHKIARLPGRNLWLIGERKKNMKQSGNTSAELLAENGYQVYGWDIEWNYNPKDYTPKQSIDELVEEIEKMMQASRTFTSDHIVLLMHSQMFGKVSEHNDLGALINKLKELDYTFEHLSSYPV